MSTISLSRFWALLLIVGIGSLASLYSQTSSSQRGVQDATPASSSSPSPSPIGPYYALVIGNNDYKELNKLQTAVGDAKALEQLLRDRFGFQTKTLYNATRAEILDALDDYQRSLPEKSNLLIYYAGHGHKDVAAHRAYWLPVDAQRDHSPNWINAVEITDKLHAIPSRHILVIADSCWSGDLTMRSAGAGITSQEHNALLARILTLKSRHIMSSGGDEPVADGGGNGHSVFTGALLQSLNDIEGDNFSAEALLEQRVKPRVAGKSQQTPEYAIVRDSDADLGDFVFFRSKDTLSERSLVSVPLRVGSEETETLKAERDKALAENTLIAQVNLALQDKNWAVAEPILQQLILTNPSRWEYLQALGSTQLGLAKYKESVASYEKAIPIATNAINADPKADPVKTKVAIGQMLMSEGSAYIKLKQNDKAIAAYTMATEVDPAPGIALFNLCAMHYNSGNIAGGLAACDKAIVADPNKADAYFIKGSLLFGSSTVGKNGKLKVPPGASDALNKYLELAPNGPHASDVKLMLTVLE